MNDEGTPPSPDAPSSTSPTPTFSKSLGFAWTGIVQTIRSQRNMRMHIGFAVMALMLAAILQAPLEHVLVILVLIGVVFAAELFNTAVEAIVDMVSPQHFRLAAVAKDAAAGAVLILAFISVVVGLIIYARAGIRLIGVS